jgi:phosphatidylserine/phosphatidylglycerophosphate/cardiolipin synthase-like enzyme
VHRRISWLLGTAAAAGLLTALLPASATAVTTTGARAAEAAAVTTTATFNDPSGPVAEQDKIRDHVVSLIDGAEAGSTINVSMYTFTDNPVREALLAAKARGVSVKVIVDNHSSSAVTDGGEYENLVAGLGTDRSKSSWVLNCGTNRGCIGTRVLPGQTGAINHNKFFLFSRTGGVDNVVVQTSANMSGIQRTDLFNNAVTIPDKGLYDIYQAYFADLVSYAGTAGLSHYYKTPSSGAYKAYFFPRQETTGKPYNDDPSTDTIKLILDNVGCAGGTQVRMAANLFTRTEIADKLVALENAGCKVTLAHDGAASSMSSTVEGIISGKLTQRVQCYEDRGAGVAKVGLHSKYLLVSGTYGGVAGKNLVFTGSHNYTYPALRAHDETLLKIDNPTLYSQFQANHDRLMSYCAGS